jgi:hypothetical protein
MNLFCVFLYAVYIFAQYINTININQELMCLIKFQYLLISLN